MKRSKSEKSLFPYNYVPPDIIGTIKIGAFNVLNYLEIKKIKQWLVMHLTQN